VPNLCFTLPPWAQQLPYVVTNVGQRAGMDREQLIQRLRARVRRGGPAEQVWWNGELLHVSEAIMRAAELGEQETIRARGDDVVIPRTLRDD
jgi:hypothetical protein